MPSPAALNELIRRVGRFGLLPWDAITGRRRYRHARFAVLTSLVILVGVLAAAFPLAFGSNRDPVYGARLERLVRQIRSAPTKPLTVVMFGSSRTLEGFRSGTLKESLTHELKRPIAVGNFGMAGCTPSMHLLTWNRLQQDGIHPDVVLIEVMPPALSERFSPVELLAERLPVSHVRHCDLQIMDNYFADIRPGLRSEWWYSVPSALYDYRLTLLSRVAPNLLPFNQVVRETAQPEDAPADPVELAPEQRKRGLDHARKEYFDLAQHYHLGGRCCANFRDLVACTHHDGVRTVLVVMPEGPIFRSWYAPGSYEQVRGLLKEIQAQYGVEIVDAREWMEEDDFRDSHHLTVVGAEKFTKRLGDECLAPMLQSRLNGQLATNQPPADR